METQAKMSQVRRQRKAAEALREGAMRVREVRLYREEGGVREMKKEKGYFSIYEILKLKGCSRARILNIAEGMVERGLIRWIDKEKGLAKITGLGSAVEEVRLGKKNN
ncbi:MAG: hypothetical protein E3J60_04430 [Dehalococcoidia bacterium]|nr:MAG: hypothetical protein E3J60_04430 [Dehalococcoidia bacterium]